MLIKSKPTLKIAGWQKVSLIDYPGRVASVVFLAGCNMCCHYCHNRNILDARQNRLPFGRVLQIIKQRRAWVDAVVVSGGEPTLYPNLIEILRYLKDLGVLVKLDTNGTRPSVVREVVELGLVDYVALDVKATATKYPLVTGMAIDSVLQTAEYLKRQNRIPYQFRTTLSPYLSQLDLLEIGKMIVCGAKTWQIQQCRCENAYSSDDVQKIASQLERYAEYIVVKGI